MEIDDFIRGLNPWEKEMLQSHVGDGDSSLTIKRRDLAGLVFRCLRETIDNDIGGPNPFLLCTSIMDCVSAERPKKKVVTTSNNFRQSSLDDWSQLSSQRGETITQHDRPTVLTSAPTTSTPAWMDEQPPSYDSIVFQNRQAEHQQRSRPSGAAVGQTSMHSLTHSSSETVPRAVPGQRESRGSHGIAAPTGEGLLSHAEWSRDHAAAHESLFPKSQKKRPLEESDQRRPFKRVAQTESATYKPIVGVGRVRKLGSNVAPFLNDARARMERRQSFGRARQEVSVVIHT